MQGNLSFSYLFPLAHNELPFPSFHISFTSSRIGIPFLTLIQFSFPSQPLLHPINFPPSTFPLPPLSTGTQGIQPRGAPCNLLRCCCTCAIASIVIFAPAESISATRSRSSWPAGGATSVFPPRDRPPPPPPQLLRCSSNIFQFFIRLSAPCSINHFLVLPGSASSASVVSCQSLQSGCPGSRNPRPAGKNARLCFETDFLVLQSGGQVVS